jgi:hypothetical protein
MSNAANHRDGPQFNWTEERITLMMERREAGDSAEAVGALLGCSRNAVLGKLHRLGMCAPKPPPKPKPQTDGRGIARRLAVRATNGNGLHRTAAKPPDAPAGLPRPPGGIPLLALTNWHCRYPITDASPFLFCGAHADLADGRSWCEEHARIVRSNRSAA